MISCLEYEKHMINVVICMTEEKKKVWNFCSECNQERKWCQHSLVKKNEEDSKPTWSFTKMNSLLHQSFCTTSEEERRVSECLTFYQTRFFSNKMKRGWTQIASLNWEPLWKMNMEYYNSEKMCMLIARIQNVKYQCFMEKLDGNGISTGTGCSIEVHRSKTERLKKKKNTKKSSHTCRKLCIPSCTKTWNLCNRKIKEYIHSTVKKKRTPVNRAKYIHVYT